MNISAEQIQLLKNYPLRVEIESLTTCEFCGDSRVSSSFFISKVTNIKIEILKRSNCSLSLTSKSLGYNWITFTTCKKSDHRRCEEEFFKENIFADCHRLETLDNFEFSHGLSSIRKDANNNLKELLKSKNIQIACSSRNINIGEVGLYLRGQVLIGAKVDLKSGVYKGRRYFRNRYDGFLESTLINSKDEYLKYTKEVEENNTTNEFILIPKNITGVWIKDYASERNKILAKQIAEVLKLTIAYVTQESVIEKYLKDTL